MFNLSEELIEIGDKIISVEEAYAETGLPIICSFPSYVHCDNLKIENKNHYKHGRLLELRYESEIKLDWFLLETRNFEVNSASSSIELRLRIRLYPRCDVYVYAFASNESENYRFDMGHFSPCESFSTFVTNLDMNFISNRIGCKISNIRFGVGFTLNKYIVAQVVQIEIR